MKDAKSRKVKNLIKEVEEYISKTPDGPKIKVTDIYLPLNHLFNSAAKKAMDRTVKELNPVRTSIWSPTITMKDEVRYFGSVAHGERNIFDAAQKVANSINALALAGYVTGALTKLIVMKLLTEPHELDKYVVVSYVAISPKGLKYLSENQISTEFKQGEIPGVLDEHVQMNLSLATDAAR